MATKFDVKINVATIILILLVIFVAFGFVFKIQRDKNGGLSSELLEEKQLKEALADSVVYYQNREKELVAEKTTMQETVKNLEKINDQLSDSQKELLNRVKQIEKKNDIIAAALIDTHLKLDSLIHKGETIVDVANEKITFKDSYKKGNKEFAYSLTVGNVVPSPLSAKPTLLFDSLYFPNKQFVEFHWKNEKKMGYPIAFSVSNSNDFFKTVNIDSYTIPEINKLKVNPNGWEKVQNFFIKNSKTLMYIGIGTAVGGVVMLAAIPRR